MQNIVRENSQFRETLRAGQRFVVTSHTRLDGDAVGALLAVTKLLKNLGKEVTAVVDGEIPKVYRFVPLVDCVSLEVKKYREPFDVLIVVDCTDLARTGVQFESLRPETTVVNVDHHPDNSLFGKVNFLDPHASSTSEIIYTLMEKDGLTFDTDILESLFIGIYTDTGRFLYANTTPKSLRIAAKLLEEGLPLHKIGQKIYQNFPPEVLNLKSLATLEIEKSDDGRLAWTTITLEMFRRTSTHPIDTQEFANIPLEVEGVEVGVLFTEISDTRVKVSLRSKRAFDAGTFARGLGGGGHYSAAGATSEKGLSETKRIVLDRLKESLGLKSNSETGKELD